MGSSKTLFHKKIPRDEMIQRLGLIDASEDTRALALEELEKIIMSRSHLAILEALPENDRLEFVDILQNTNAITAVNFLRKKLPFLKDLLTEVADRTVKEFMRIRGLA